ncbi:MAG: hypothetical protein ABJN84_06830 [Flavobacteriaceae bacterium]
MKKKHPITLLLILLFCSCSPKIASYVNKDYPALKYDEKVEVFGLNEPPPDNAIQVGTVEIRDTGFSVKCNYEIVLDQAKLEARRVGGNVIKIIKHKKPDFWSTCHRLDAIILKLK